MSEASKRQSIPDAIEDVRVYLTWVPPSHAKGAADALQSLEEQLKAYQRLVSDADVARGCADARYDALKAKQIDRSTWREGMVTVYDYEGRYVGCIGRESWDWLLEQGYEKCRASVEQLESLRAALEDIAANGGSVGMHVPPPVREFARAVLASSPRKAVIPRDRK